MSTLSELKIALDEIWADLVQVSSIKNYNYTIEGPSFVRTYRNLVTHPIVDKTKLEGEWQIYYFTEHSHLFAWNVSNI